MEPKGDMFLVFDELTADQIAQVEKIPGVSWTVTSYGYTSVYFDREAPGFDSERVVDALMLIIPDAIFNGVGFKMVIPTPLEPDRPTNDPRWS